MLSAITQLLIFQLFGELITRLFHWPVPGPVLGMALLFGTLVFREGPSEPLKKTSSTLLQNLSLLFIPAGAGLMLHFQRVSDEWVALVVSIVISTCITLGISGLVLYGLSRRGSKK
jgi:holin-like protein